MLPIQCCENMQLKWQQDENNKNWAYLVCKNCSWVHDYRDPFYNL